MSPQGRRSGDGGNARIQAALLEQEGLAYAAQVYSNQLASGRPYKDLKKVYAINVLGGLGFAKDGDILHSWVPRDGKNPQAFMKRYEFTNQYDPSEKIRDIQLIQLFPQLFDGKADYSGTSLKGIQERHTLEEWLLLFKEGEKYTPAHVSRVMKDPGVLQAYTLLSSEGAHKSFEGWVSEWGPKYADELLETAVEAKAEGKLEGKAEIVRKMLQKGLSLDEICELTGFSVLELEKLRDELGSG